MNDAHLTYREIERAIPVLAGAGIHVGHDDLAGKAPRSIAAELARTPRSRKTIMELIECCRDDEGARYVTDREGA